jgi:hypothetical protein
MPSPTNALTYARAQIKVSRERLQRNEMSAKEQDGFSQLVFDLSCACFWDE